MTFDCLMCDECTFLLDSEQNENVYEIHVTVNTLEPLLFEKVCLDNDIKPIIIEFQRHTGGLTETQVMTAQKVKGSPLEMTREVTRIRKVLRDYGFEVIRTKIETGPSDENICYHEAHFQIRTTEDDVDRLRPICESINIHLSRNTRAKDAHTITMMATHRSYGTDAKTFVREAKTIRNSLILNGVNVGKVIAETCIYDSNESVDKNWIKS